MALTYEPFDTVTVNKLNEKLGGGIEAINGEISALSTDIDNWIKSGLVKKWVSDQQYYKGDILIVQLDSNNPSQCFLYQAYEDFKWLEFSGYSANNDSEWLTLKVRNPEDDKEVANKQYVDNKASQKLDTSGGVMTGGITMNNTSEYMALYKTRTVYEKNYRMTLGVGVAPTSGASTLELYNDSLTGASYLSRMELRPSEISFITQDNGDTSAQKQHTVLHTGNINNYALPVTGGTTSGNIIVQSSTYPKVVVQATSSTGDGIMESSGTTTLLAARSVAGNANDYRALLVRDANNQPNVNRALQFANRVNGGTTTYTILHEGNVSEYASRLERVYLGSVSFTVTQGNMVQKTLSLSTSYARNKLVSFYGTNSQGTNIAIDVIPMVYNLETTFDKVWIRIYNVDGGLVGGDAYIYLIQEKS